MIWKSIKCACVRSAAHKNQTQKLSISVAMHIFIHFDFTIPFCAVPRRATRCVCTTVLLKSIERFTSHLHITIQNVKKGRNAHRHRLALENLLIEYLHIHQARQLNKIISLNLESIDVLVCVCHKQTWGILKQRRHRCSRCNELKTVTLIDLFS